MERPVVTSWGESVGVTYRYRCRGPLRAQLSQTFTWANSIVQGVIDAEIRDGIREIGDGVWNGRAADRHPPWAPETVTAWKRMAPGGRRGDPSTGGGQCPRER